MISILNNHEGKTIPFGNRVDIHPGNNIITDHHKIVHLRKQRKALEMYTKTTLHGRTKVLEIVAGGLDDPTEFEKAEAEAEKKKKSKKKNKKDDPTPEVKPDSPLKDFEEDEAVDMVNITNDVESLNGIIATEEREKVVNAAKNKLEELRS